MTKRASFPLQWPEGWARTPSHRRERSSFSPRFVEDRDHVLRWLERRGTSVVITSNMPTRRDGLPYYATGIDDPGIAVWWVELKISDGKRSNIERVLACDHWRRADENMRAIAKALDALRGLERWGTHQIIERAFAGFAALPPGTADQAPTPRPQRDWWDVLDAGALYTLFVGGRIHAKDLLSIAKQRHRALIIEHHPDKGGDPAIAAEINAALEAAEKELT